MSHASSAAEVAELSGKLGQLIRSNELKMAGKLLATARGHLYQLAEHDPVYQPRYSVVADLRNELMEPGGEDFDERKLLQEMLNEEKELRKIIAQKPTEPAVMSHTLLKSAAAIVLVYAQDLAGDTPLEM